MSAAAASDDATLRVAVGGKRAGRGPRQVHILQALAFDAPAGHFVTLLGPSGCGKTTLLRMIAGLDADYDGAIRIGEHTVSAPGRDRGIVFQEPRLLPWLSVRDNVAFALDDSRRDVGLVETAVRRVGLQGFEHALPRELSGGMAQRVALARALVTRPRVLLLDEPFGALDSFTRARMQAELRTVLDGERISTVLITHDVDEALVLSDEVLVLSPRPARIIERVPVDLPHPRYASDPEVLALRGRILRLLEH